MPPAMSANNTNTPPTPAPPVRWIIVAFLCIYALDQATKFLITQSLALGDEHIVVEGFFRFVHWGNTGASWSLFWGNNTVLAVIAAGAFIALIFARKHFNTSTLILGLCSSGNVKANKFPGCKNNYFIARIKAFVSHQAIRLEIGNPIFIIDI